MTEPKKSHLCERERFMRDVGDQEGRKMDARQFKVGTIWAGFSMFGLIGWSIVVPTLIGAFLGVWLDRNHPINHSWTLALLVAGLVLGCLNAWNWLAKEERTMRSGGEKRFGGSHEK